MLNRDFHNVISDAACNPEATRVLERHWLLIAALWNVYGYGEKRVAGVISDHRQMIEALVAHDAEVAACLAMAHAAKAKQALIARMLARRSAASGQRRERRAMSAIDAMSGRANVSPPAVSVRFGVTGRWLLRRLEFPIALAVVLLLWQAVSVAIANKTLLPSPLLVAAGLDCPAAGGSARGRAGEPHPSRRSATASASLPVLRLRC